MTLGVRLQLGRNHASPIVTTSRCGDTVLANGAQRCYNHAKDDVIDPSTAPIKKARE
jgi:hypothetical protein